jgi:hypothetical protein
MTRDRIVIKHHSALYRLYRQKTTPLPSAGDALGLRGGFRKLILPG